MATLGDVRSGLVCYRDADLEELLGMVKEHDLKEQAGECVQDNIKLVSELGGRTTAYRESTAAEVRAVLSEVYSRPRVSRRAKLMPSFGIIPGFALDLSVNSQGEFWDFTRYEHRKAAREMRDE